MSTYFHSRSTLPVISLFFLFSFLLNPSPAHAERIFSSGCELQGETGGSMTNNLEWERGSWNGGITEISTSIKRSGLSSCRLGAPSSAGGARIIQRVRSSLDQETFYVRFYLYIAQMPALPSQIFAFTDGTSYTGGSLRLNNDGTVSFLDEDESALGTATTPLSTNTWHRIEIGANFLGDVVGGGSDNHHIVVRVNGLDEIRVYHDESDIHEWDAVMFGLCVMGNECSGSPSYITTGDLYFDDIALNTATGNFQNTWPGEGSIVHLRPNATGDTNECNGQNYTHVSEVTPDDSTTICVLPDDGDILDVNIVSPRSLAVDQRDSVALVQVGVRQSAAGTAGSSYRLRVKSAPSATPLAGSTVSHNDSTPTFRTNGDSVPRNYTLTSYVDLTTGCSWKQTGLNSLENAQIGIEATDTTPDVHVSTLWALVEFNTQFQRPCAAPTAGNPSDSLTVATSKNGTYKQIKTGGLWANSIAADYFCLKNDQNCTSTWDPPARCRLEHHRVIARPSYPLIGTDFITPGAMTTYDISTNLCDGLLSTPSKRAGWVSTGYDYTNRYLSGQLNHPRICQFTRIACDGINVAINSSETLSAGPLLYPVSPTPDGFSTTSTFQCSDGVNNDGDSDVDWPADTQCASWSDNDESI